MSSDGVNSDRRKFLTAATSAVGVAGAVGVAIPFVGSWNPSASAKAAGAPVKADIGKLEPGQLVVVEWRGKPVYVVHRTPEQLAGLEGLNDQLKDPNSETSVQPDYITGIDRSLPATAPCTAPATSPDTSGPVGIWMTISASTSPWSRMVVIVCA